MIQSIPAPLKGFVRISKSTTEIVNKLGPLAGLVGSWNGNLGWNLIAVPSPTDGFQLLIQNFSEKITFTPVGAPVPNRGGKSEQFVVALMYELTVIDKSTQGVLHVENGMWLNLSDIEQQKLDLDANFPICRQSSIPHGDVVIALGSAIHSTGAPPISDINTLPDAGSAAPLGYTDPYLNTGFPEFNAANPNAMLKEVLAKQQIGKVMTLDVDTTNPGSSINNIPFVEIHVKPSQFKSTFWIEEVLNPDGSVSFQQLQYSQQTNLNFLRKAEADGPGGLIMWPHVNVNTLVKE